MLNLIIDEEKREIKNNKPKLNPAVKIYKIP